MAVFIAIIALLSSVAATAAETDRWSAAEQAIVRVSESAFPNLSVRNYCDTGTWRKLIGAD